MEEIYASLGQVAFYAFPAQKTSLLLKESSFPYLVDGFDSSVAWPSLDACASILFWSLMFYSPVAELTQPPLRGEDFALTWGRPSLMYSIFNTTGERE